MSATLNALISRQLEARASAMLLEAPGGRSFRFGEADVASGRIAAALQALGVKPGDRVCAQTEKSPEALMLYLACLRLGAIYQPVNPAYRDAEMGYFLADAEPSVVIADPARADALDALGRPIGLRRVLSLDGSGRGSLMELAASAPERSAPGWTQAREEDTAVILYSSGTTGRPKGAMLTQANLASNAAMLVEAWGFSAEDRLIHALPLFHAHGLFVAAHCALLGGCPMLWQDRFDAAETIRLLPRASVFMGVPTYYARLLQEPALNKTAAKGMRLFVSGSAPLLMETFGEFERRTGHRILERYGMTETAMNASNPLEGERRPGSVGKALPGIALRVADEADRVLAPGKVGGLQVKGPNVFSGYWRRPEKRAEDFTEDGWFRTGDLATIDEGGYVTIVGRAKDLIITGGLNVYPKEVELVIDEIAGVEESAVVGLPDPDFGEAVTAFIVAKSKGGDLSEGAIIARVKERLANYKVPKRVVFVDALPRNAMGKVQKNRLRAAG